MKKHHYHPRVELLHQAPRFPQIVVARCARLLLRELTLRPCPALVLYTYVSTTKKRKLATAKIVTHLISPPHRLLVAAGNLDRLPVTHLFSLSPGVKYTPVPWSGGSTGRPGKNLREFGLGVGSVWMKKLRDC